MKTKELEHAASLFAALGHPARLGIVRKVLSAHPRGLCVSDVQEALGIPGSTLTHHLETLRIAGLIDMERQGRRLIYRACTQELAGVIQFLFMECCTRSGAMQASQCLPSAKGCASDKQCCEPQPVRNNTKRSRT